MNVLGTIHTIAAFLPLLRASESPTKKIVVVSTAGADPKTVHALGMANMVAYGATKAAQLIATTKWALKLKDDPGFIVVSLSPGLVDTSSTMGEHGALSGSTSIGEAHWLTADRALRFVLQGTRLCMRLCDVRRLR